METQTPTLAIANEIVRQINVCDRMALMAYGARKFQALPESKEFQGGIRFLVNGRTHKSWVLIQLRWVDDYTLIFLSKTGELVHKIEGIYCDQLVDALDWVEGK
jgi:hypothetical protein